jgi:glycosyltransferase involved in cell wall biosynthesis
MKQYIINSPLTSHFSKIHIIPFGITVEEFKKIKNNRVIIGFRADNCEIKGCNYLYQSLMRLKGYETKLELQCVGDGEIPEDIIDKYNVREYGWINDRDELKRIMQKWDIFVMPSIGESFGMMAIEALGCKCALICFENTPMRDITKAPRYASVAKYMNSADLKKKIQELVDDSLKRKRYQDDGFQYVKKKYSKDLYFERHIQLYEKILEENSTK